jgi:hypothetical protein
VILPAAERRRQRELRASTGISDPRQPAAWSNLLACPAGEIFSRRYTPASRARPVHVRRFPHRYADIVGVVPFGAVAVATAIAYDPKDREWYAEWAPQLGGGFSRLRGALGPFLIQLWPGRETTVLDPPRFYGVSDEFGKGVRVRSAPCLKTGVIVAPELRANEVRAAVALHSGIDEFLPAGGDDGGQNGATFSSPTPLSDSVFVEWADGSGYSRRSARTYVMAQWLQDKDQGEKRKASQNEARSLREARRLQRQIDREDGIMGGEDEQNDEEEDDDDADNDASDGDEQVRSPPDVDVETRVFLQELPQIRSAIVALAKKS